MSQELEGFQSSDGIRQKIYLNPISKRFKDFIKKCKEFDFLNKIYVTIELIKRDYTIGEMKSQDLKGIRAVDFTYEGVSYRLAYIAYKEKDSIEINFYFVYVGTRENYYKELKDYVNSNKYIRRRMAKGK